MNVTELSKLLKKHPNAYIYYHDTGDFLIYTSKEDFMKEYHGEGEFEKYELYAGKDREGRGYIPFMVEVLARMQGFEVDSV